MNRPDPTPGERPTPDTVDLAEKGRSGGQVTRLDRRLYMQLHVIEGYYNEAELIDTLNEQSSDQFVLYADLNHPRGLGLLSWDEDPGAMTDRARDLVDAPGFAELRVRPELSMLGRSYAVGYEPDLEEILINRPIRHATTADWPWAIWYPLRRKGEFARLPEQEQRSVLMEHGGIGRAYVESGHAYDIRLASYGLDTQDNDFTIGLMGPSLHGLSAIVQAMRASIQTSTYLEKLGPFFVGKKIWQAEG